MCHTSRKRNVPKALPTFCGYALVIVHLARQRQYPRQSLWSKEGYSALLRRVATRRFVANEPPLIFFFLHHVAPSALQVFRCSLHRLHIFVRLLRLLAVVVCPAGQCASDIGSFISYRNSRRIDPVESSLDVRRGMCAWSEEMDKPSVSLAHIYNSSGSW